LLVALGSLFGLGHGLSYPALNAMIMDRVRSEQRGRVMTLFNGCFNAGVTASTLLLGSFAKHAGYPLTFTVAGLFTLSALFVLGRVAEGPLSPPLQDRGK
jgi:MFS family permease